MRSTSCLCRFRNAALLLPLRRAAAARTGQLTATAVHAWLGAGGCLGILNYEVNLQRLGNAISLWLGIQPPDLFFYAVCRAALRCAAFT